MSHWPQTTKSKAARGRERKPAWTAAASSNAKIARLRRRVDLAAGCLLAPAGLFARIGLALVRVPQPPQLADPLQVVEADNKETAVLDRLGLSTRTGAALSWGGARRPGGQSEPYAAADPGHGLRFSLCRHSLARGRRPISWGVGRESGYCR